MGERRIDAVDVIVGKNIRILRQSRGLSQTDLGRRINVTFQQVQKYENGTNRVGGGRLFKIADVLQAPITAFFDGARETFGRDPANSPVALLAEPLVLRLVQTFCAIDNTEIRRSIVELTEIVATKFGVSTERADDP